MCIIYSMPVFFGLEFAHKKRMFSQHNIPSLCSISIFNQTGYRNKDKQREREEDHEKKAIRFCNNTEEYQKKNI